MKIISRLERASALDQLVKPGQKLAKVVTRGRLGDALHGVQLGHPVHPPLVQVPVGAWLCASVVGLRSDGERTARALTVLGLAGAAPAAIAGLADWSQQHEQQLRVGVVHALTNTAATTCFASSLAVRAPAASRAMRLAGLAPPATGVRAH